MKLKIVMVGLGALALIAAGCNKKAAQVQQPSQPVVENNEQQNSAKDQAMSDDRILGILFRDNEAFTIWPGNELVVLDHDAMLDNGVKVSKVGLITLSNGAAVQLKNGQEVDRQGKIKQANADLMKMKAMMPENNMMKGASSTEGSTMQQPGAYINYSADALALAEKSGGRTVIFFHANWCPYCRAAEADFQAHLNQIPAGVTILQADYDTETVLKQQYGITHQDTFVQVGGSGKAITQWTSGGLGIQALLSNLKS